MKLPSSGKARAIINRIRADLSLINTVLMLFIADKVGVAFEWWYIPVGIAVLAIRIYWDDKRLIRQEVDYMQSKSTIFMELKRQVDFLYNQSIEKKEKELNDWEQFDL